MKAEINDRTYKGPNYKTILEQIDQDVRKMFAGSFNPVFVKGPAGEWLAIMYRTPHEWWYRLIAKDSPAVNDSLSANSVSGPHEGLSKIKYHIAQLSWGDGKATEEEVIEWIGDDPAVQRDFELYVRLVKQMRKEIEEEE